jgi:hypothetical protein
MFVQTWYISLYREMSGQTWTKINCQQFYSKKYIKIYILNYNIFKIHNILTIYYTILINKDQNEHFFSLVCFSPLLYTFSISILFKTNWHLEQKMLTVMEYLYHKWPWICSTYVNTSSLFLIHDLSLGL